MKGLIRLYSHYVWLKEDAIEANPAESILDFDSDEPRGAIYLHTAFFSDAPEIEVFVKVTASYYAAENFNEEELKKSLTTDGMAPAIRFSVRGGWSVSRWRYDYEKRLCSFMLSRRLPVYRMAHVSLLMSEILAFAPGGTAEVMLEFFGSLPNASKSVVLKIKKTTPTEEIRLNGLIPAEVFTGPQYTLEENVRPSFAITATVSGVKNLDVRGARIVDGKEAVKLPVSGMTLTDNTNIGTLLGKAPGSVAYKAALHDGGVPVRELTARVYCQPPRLVSFRPSADGKNVEWVAVNIDALRYNGIANKNKNRGGGAVPEGAAAKVFLVYYDGYTAADVYPFVAMGFFARRTIIAFWESGSRIIRLEWGAINPNSKGYFISEIRLLGDTGGERLLDSTDGHSGITEYALREGDPDFLKMVFKVQVSGRAQSVTYDMRKGTASV